MFGRKERLSNTQLHEELRNELQKQVREFDRLRVEFPPVLPISSMPELVTPTISQYVLDRRSRDLDNREKLVKAREDWVDEKEPKILSSLTAADDIPPSGVTDGQLQDIYLPGNLAADGAEELLMLKKFRERLSASVPKPVFGTAEAVFNALSYYKDQDPSLKPFPQTRVREGAFSEKVVDGKPDLD